MSLQKLRKKYFSDFKEGISIFFLSSKIAFVISVSLFFSVYFFVSGHFYDQFLITFVAPLYLSFLISFVCVLCFGTWLLFYGKIPSIILIGISLLFLVLGGFFLVPLL